MPALVQVRARAAPALLAVADQGMFALAGFAVTIVAGRALSTADVGLYAVLQSCALLLATVHSAALLEPGIVLICGYPTSRAAQLRQLIRWHGLALGGMLLAGAVAAVADRRIAVQVLTVAILAAGLSSLLMVRRLAHAVGIGWIAAGASSLSTITVVSLVVSGSVPAGPSPYLLTYGGVSLAVAAAGMAVLRRSLRGRAGVGADEPYSLGDKHWRFARWSVASSIVYWVLTTSLPILVTAVSGRTTAGVYARAAALVGPLGQLLAAASLVALPAVSRRRGGVRFGRTVDRYSAMLGIGVAVLAAPLLLAPATVLSFAYSGAGGASAGVLQLLAVAAILDAFRQGWVLGLTALERASSVFVARLVTLAAVALPLPLLLMTLGASGAAWSLVLGNGLTGLSARRQLARAALP